MKEMWNHKVYLNGFKSKKCLNLEHIEFPGLKKYRVKKIKSNEFIVQLQTTTSPMPLWIYFRNEILHRLNSLNLNDVSFTLEVIS